MPGNERSEYLDSCVLLAYVEGETGRVGVVDDVLRDGRDGKRKLCTSVLSIIVPVEEPTSDRLPLSSG